MNCIINLILFSDIPKIFDSYETYVKRMTKISKVFDRRTYIKKEKKDAFILEPEHERTQANATEQMRTNIHKTFGRERFLKRKPF